MPKEITILIDMHILQDNGKHSSITSVFLRGQGWGFAACMLLLYKEGIDQKG